MNLIMIISALNMNYKTSTILITSEYRETIKKIEFEIKIKLDNSL